MPVDNWDPRYELDVPTLRGTFCTLRRRKEGWADTAVPCACTTLRPLKGNSPPARAVLTSLVTWCCSVQTVIHFSFGLSASHSISVHPSSPHTFAVSGSPLPVNLAVLFMFQVKLWLSSAIEVMPEPWSHTSHTFIHPSSAYKTKVDKIKLAENVSGIYMTEGWEVSCSSDRSVCSVRSGCCCAGLTQGSVSAAIRHRLYHRATF